MRRLGLLHRRRWQAAWGDSEPVLERARSIGSTPMHPKATHGQKVIEPRRFLSGRSEIYHRAMPVPLTAKGVNMHDVTSNLPFIWILLSRVRDPRINTNTYKFTGFGDIHGPKPYEFIGFGDIHGPRVPDPENAPQAP